MIKPSEFTDITYEVSELIATITINRPDRYNALRGRTVDELLAAFKHAWVDK
ncbi:MAG: 1,4-dihydroxy-2-naphthoyl-CoA synthase, partial [Actinobacteria bacterium]|nr:1,4-dihydroxy-2-naphthoyl-CoA synthase [Actinomycetota bacterium]